MTEAATAVPPVGTLTDRVQFQRADGDDFVPVATIWSRVRALSSRAEPTPGISHHVVTRFRTDVKAGDRFVFRGLLLLIVDTADLNGRRAYSSHRCRQVPHDPR